MTMLKIKSPYKYEEFKRTSVDGKRLYETPWGDPVPSVTTILSATQSAEKRAGLARWKKRVGDSEAQRIVTEASNVGSVMHNILEKWFKNEEYNPGNNMVHKQAKGMAQVVIDNVEPDINEVWGSEVNLVAKDLYAGTTDLVGMYKGKPTIMDFKQTNKPKKTEWIADYFMQLCAYAAAHNEVHGTDIKQGVILMCSKDFKYQTWTIEGEDFEEYSRQWWSRVGEYYGA